jgi:hypothetical protein
MLDKILLFFNENHGISIAAALVVIFGVWFYGCESTVRSLNDPNVKVTRTELQGEINAYLATAQSKMRTLDEQDAIRKVILDNASIIAASGSFNPIGAINALISILAIGSAVDSRNKVAKLTATATPST